MFSFKRHNFHFLVGSEVLKVKRENTRYITHKSVQMSKIGTKHLHGKSRMMSKVTKRAVEAEADMYRGYDLITRGKSVIAFVTTVTRFPDTTKYNRC